MQVSVQKIVPAAPRQMRGPQHQARLVFGPEDVSGTSPFLLMAEDWFAPPAGFPMHPHRGMETVTFVLEGQLEHRDHTGAHAATNAGGIQFMTGGGGVMHSEMPGPHGVQSLQLWLNLPARLKRTPARYRGLQQTDAPVHREAGVEARVYAGRVGDAAIEHGSTWPITVIDLRLDAGTEYDLPVPAGERLFAYVLEGAAKVGAESRNAATGTVAWAGISEHPSGYAPLRFVAATRFRALVFASPVIDEPVVLGGPFVMNTQQEIVEAFADLRAGRLTAV